MVTERYLDWCGLTRIFPLLEGHVESTEQNSTNLLSNAPLVVRLCSMRSYAMLIRKA
jgi:hypothetical protein